MISAHVRYKNTWFKQKERRLQNFKASFTDFNLIQFKLININSNQFINLLLENQ